MLVSLNFSQISTIQNLIFWQDFLWLSLLILFPKQRSSIFPNLGRFPFKVSIYLVGRWYKFCYLIHNSENTHTHTRIHTHTHIHTHRGIVYGLQIIWKSKVSLFFVFFLFIKNVCFGTSLDCLCLIKVLQHVLTSYFLARRKQNICQNNTYLEFIYLLQP